ncbi:DUF6907 domain-containing protein [Streptomyces sp. NPDC051064]|uniref:DUF6907 domain-containing protein n=1 Tax=Streptomyces sp. NPDC051064 TaxID=3365641 RepID=UPI00378AE3A2
MPNTSRSTVPASFKPSGSLVAPPAAPDPLETALRSAFDQGEPCDAEGNPAVQDRTITYPLMSGGFLVDVCPSWCILDHADDVERGLASPEDLVHEGAQVALPFPGIERGLLAASVRQWPHDTDHNGSNLPHIALMPDADSGDDLGYLTPTQLNAEIQRTRQHLVELQRLAEQVAGLRADAHQQGGGAVGELEEDDVQSMPLPHLLAAFGARVVEGDPEGFGNLMSSFLLGKAGDWQIMISRELTQCLREQVVRGALLTLHRRAGR